jgi:putative sigma-54 modulation protein
LEKHYESADQWTPPRSNACVARIRVIDGSVVLSVDNHKEKDKRQKVEINLHLKGKDIFVESCDSDLYAAIDLMIDKLDRQVIRHKDRLQGHQHEAIKYQPAPQLDVPPQ